MKNEGNSSQKLKYKEMSFSCASIIWIRFQGTFSGDLFFPKPPPPTKLPQFIAIGKNVKQNKDDKIQSFYFFCFLSIHAFSEKETVQSLNASKLDVNNLHTKNSAQHRKKGSLLNFSITNRLFVFCTSLLIITLLSAKNVLSAKKVNPVSYTHLTLPTICSV